MKTTDQNVEEFLREVGVVYTTSCTIDESGAADGTSRLCKLDIQLGGESFTQYYLQPDNNPQRIINTLYYLLMDARWGEMPYEEFCAEHGFLDKGLDDSEEYKEYLCHRETSLKIHKIFSRKQIEQLQGLLDKS